MCCCILFFILSSWNISDICESNNSALFQKAVEKVYETIPENYNYRLFQFFDNDDDLVVEIACKNIIITKKIKIYLSSNGMNLSYKYNINGALTKKTTPFGIIDMHYNNSGLHETIHTQLLNHS